MHRRVAQVLVGLICGLLVNTSHSAGKGPRVLPANQRPDDVRLRPLKDLDGYFPFEVPATTADWEVRAAQVRQQMLVATGLSPLPTRSELKPVIHGTRDMGDYSVAKVYFESMPGFFVTGNLYRPRPSEGKRPGVLCPHGHWSNGRFYDCGESEINSQIKSGAESLANGGRSPLQSRCVNLARMGCVVFHYDMIGYADSVQIGYQVAHRFARQRPEMNRPQGWGLYSPQAESHGQSIMGLQTYNSIRALDFLCSLADVDPDRLAVTGASGGGTQTFMLAAVDPRPRVAFPAVMVSTAMQGGCTCENACHLRVGTGNVEIAALFAPKPLGVSAANDWTKEMSSKGFPELQKLYSMLGAPQNVMLISRTEFGHNYNQVSRLAMYGWLNQHLQLNVPQPIVEREYERLTAADLTVWDEQHPKPESTPEFERGLLDWWHRDTQQQLEALVPKTESMLTAYRNVVGGGVNAILGRRLPDAKDLEYEQTVKEQRDGYLEMAGLLSYKKRGEQVPVLFLYPNQWNGKVVIWLHPAGKAGLLDDDGQPTPAARRLIAAGQAVVGIDLFQQGEFLPDNKPIGQTRRVANPRESAAYTFGYNPTLFAQRVHDVLTVIAYVRAHDYQPQEVCLVGLEGAGHWAAAARALAGNAVNRAAIHSAGFRFGQVDDLSSVDFLPGGARYFDLVGMLSLSAPDPLWLAGESADSIRVARQVYQASGAEQALRLYQGEQVEQGAVDWLLGR